MIRSHANSLRSPDRIVDVLAKIREVDDLERKRLWADELPPVPLYVVVDATGVGTPVVELIRDALGDLRVQLTAVKFTSAEGKTGYLGDWELHVSKTYFASRLKSLVQTDRIHLPDTPEARQLAQELQTYELRATKNATLVLGAFGKAHDDLVTVLGLAVVDDAPLWGLRRARSLWG